MYAIIHENREFSTASSPCCDSYLHRPHDADPWFCGDCGRSYEPAPNDDSTAFYPRSAEDFSRHRGCRKNLSGTHRGNRYCLDHKVAVKPREDSR